MPIVTGDLLWKYSVKTGSAGNSTASSAAASLGKYISTTAFPDATLNGLFDDISGPENAASTVDYRCVFLHNNHASLTLQNAVLWMGEVANGANAAIAVDTTAASAIGSASAQAAEIANETTAPGGQSFSSPTTFGTGLSIGNLAAGNCRGIWVRRTATNSAAQNNDGVTLYVQGDTAA